MNSRVIHYSDKDSTSLALAAKARTAARVWEILSDLGINFDITGCLRPTSLEPLTQYPPSTA
jgi:hypothetical protein